MSIHLISCFELIAVLILQRAATLRIALATSRCQEILTNDNLIASGSAFDLPIRLEHGQRLPEIKLTNLITGTHLNRDSIFGISSVLVFCTVREYEQWNAGVLFAFLQSCWNRIDGNIFIIFLDQPVRQFFDLPHLEIFDTDIGKDIVLCRADRGRVFGTFELSRTPCILELDKRAVVTRIGLFGDAT